MARLTKKAKNKSELQEEMRSIIADFEGKRADAVGKDKKYNDAYLDALYKFYNKIVKQSLPDAPGKDWEYHLIVHDTAFCVNLVHTNGVSEIDGIKRINIDAIYKLYEMRHKYISVKEYAELHETTEEAVERWIRERNLTKIKVIDGNYYVMEYEKPQFIAENVMFYWSENANFENPKYMYLNEYRDVSVREMEDGKYEVELGLCVDDNQKIIILSKKEKEELEMELIKRPYVTCARAAL